MPLKHFAQPPCDRTGTTCAVCLGGCGVVARLPHLMYLDEVVRDRGGRVALQRQLLCLLDGAHVLRLFQRCRVGSFPWPGLVV